MHASGDGVRAGPLVGDPHADAHDSSPVPANAPDAAGHRLALRPGDQLAIWLLVGALGCVLVSQAFRCGLGAGELLAIDHAPPRRVCGGIDINRADWPLVASLPGVGESLARRIVAFRDEHGNFACVEGLRRVEGVGPKTLEAIRGHVRIGDPGFRGGSQNGPPRR